MSREKPVGGGGRLSLHRELLQRPDNRHEQNLKPTARQRPKRVRRRLRRAEVELREDHQSYHRLQPDDSGRLAEDDEHPGCERPDCGNHDIDADHTARCGPDERRDSEGSGRHRHDLDPLTVRAL